MFDSKQTQIADSYLEITNIAGKAAEALAKVLIELAKIAAEKLKEGYEATKIAVEVGKDTFNLVPDESTPGGYKWEKVDLTKPTEQPSHKSSQSEDKYSELPKVITNQKGDKSIEYDEQQSRREIQPIEQNNGGQIQQQTEEINSELPIDLTNFQAQVIALRLVQDVGDFSLNSNSTKESPLRITAYLENANGNSNKITLYEQNEEGKCITNLVTDTLSQSEIMDVVGEPLTKLLPPSSEIIQNYNNEQKLINDTITIDFEPVEQPNVDNTTNQDEVNSNNNQPKLSNTIEQNNQTAPLQSPEIIFSGDVDYSNPPDEDLPPFDNNPGNNDLLQQSNPTQKITHIDDLPPPDAYSVKSKKSETEEASAPTESNQRVIEETSVLVSQNNQPEKDENITKQATTPQPSSHSEPTKKVAYPEKEPTQLVKAKQEEEEIPKPKYAAQHTYEQVASSPGVEPAAQQWAKQVEVPVYKIKNIFAREERFKNENKEIAKTATSLLKKYGTIEQDGSRIYRSDTFVIRQDGDKFSIHRRSDELQGWKDSLLEFKLDGKENPKIIKANKEMLGVERQEFLMVAEKLADNGKLPDLGKDDIRDIGNTLGSLAPAGTIKTLETFKQAEVLSSLNSILTQANKDEITVGEYTIKRSLNKEGDKATFQAFKTSEEKGNQELVRFDLTKTEEGVTREVTKMNISDYDVNQIKFIAQNTAKLDYDQIFVKEQPVNQPENKEKSIQSIGDIPVKIHPSIAKEWNDMVKTQTRQGQTLDKKSAETLEEINKPGGKLPIANQRVMYYQALEFKTEQAKKQNQETVALALIKDVMSDLQQWRKEEINQQYTPTQKTFTKQQENTHSIQSNKSNLEL
ncbi:MAG: hypothetical protein KME64_37690 [Scytonematopsis contorta HA4267-MV1]|jgi:protein-tyrosine-phosphatase|nr:hypothetical protein [Scytonematopsis contorta HA4267-MV1]